MLVERHFASCLFDLFLGEVSQTVQSISMCYTVEGDNGGILGKTLVVVAGTLGLAPKSFILASVDVVDDRLNEVFGDLGEVWFMTVSGSFTKPLPFWSLVEYSCRDVEFQPHQRL